ncbi:hypothetical protein DZJ_22510 [Dickeya ananatis]
MMLAILAIFTLLWGGVGIFSLYSLNNLTDEISLTNVQQANGDIINGASDRYYNVKLSMDEAIAAENSSDHGRNLLNDAAADVEFLKNGLAQFKVTDHANISSTSIDDIYNSSYQLFSEAIVPMLDAARQGNHDAYVKLVTEKYNPLRIKFTTAISHYNQIIKKSENRSAGAHCRLGVLEQSDADRRHDYWVRRGGIYRSLSCHSDGTPTGASESAFANLVEWATRYHD